MVKRLKIKWLTRRDEWHDEMFVFFKLYNYILRRIWRNQLKAIFCLKQLLTDTQELEFLKTVYIIERIF